MRKYGERTSMSYRFPSTKEMGNIGYGNTKLRRLYIFSKIGEKGSTFSRIPPRTYVVRNQTHRCNFNVKHYLIMEHSPPLPPPSPLTLPLPLPSPHTRDSIFRFFHYFSPFPHSLYFTVLQLLSSSSSYSSSPSSSWAFALKVPLRRLSLLRSVPTARALLLLLPLLYSSSPSSAHHDG